MTAAVRCDPPAPPVQRRPESRTAFAALLREHTGQWAVLGQHNTAACARQDAYEIRRGLRPMNAGFAVGRWQAEARTVCGEYRVYVRHLDGR